MAREAVSRYAGEVFIFMTIFAVCCSMSTFEPEPYGRVFEVKGEPGSLFMAFSAGLAETVAM